MTVLTGGGSSPPDEPATVLYIGQHETRRTQPVTPGLMQKAQQSGYDVLTSPITTHHFQSRVLLALQRHVDQLSQGSSPISVPMPLISPLLSEDTELGPEESNASVIAVTSSWIDLGSPDPLIASVSRQVFHLEIAYAAFVGATNVLVHGPIEGSDVVQYARAIQEAVGLGPYLQLHIWMPMAGELVQDEYSEDAHLGELTREQFLLDPEDDLDEASNPYGKWDDWNTIRTICNYNSKVAVALELPRHLPSLALQSRWYSEPVRLLTIPKISFLDNAKAYPVLSKQQQQYLNRFCRLRFPPWMLLQHVGPVHSAGSDTEQEPTPAEAAKRPPQDSFSHLKYIRHLQYTQPVRPPMERFGQGYQDYMQSPLQPLTDNLESITYEVFEKDPVKYEWYERAVALALKDLKIRLGPDRSIVVAVVGAGRGPLVTRVLQASRSTGIEVEALAVEKNPNAHVLLQRRNATDPLWNNAVTIVKTDMRSWSGPLTSTGEVGKVDILVSELLGSFADNELSPECLDGVQHVLHPEHGINIPQSYSAHLTPIASPRLYADLLSRTTTDLNMLQVEKWELPYVVMLHQYDYLSVQPETAETAGVPNVQEAWSFAHPAPKAILKQAEKRAGGTLLSGSGGWVGGDGRNEHNARFSTSTFTCPNPGVCHGIAGYFETILYASSTTNETVELSTNPVTMDHKSKDMISWFPIFFPFKTPLTVPEGAEMVVKMWRQTDDRKVWYEWIAEMFVRSQGKGRRRVGMSDLHSSRANGCLM
ncbi:protein arginine N-methyltransferase [Teratosphaeria nubilosa]|uniref:Protein arginine N-methyltransferase n=1 Tax=Teratosphaeria nubilosa TaxID=161662 RepID=A0A6G1LIK6_9PEZI|nr:protein arginine N-methyltransferase [Teratosphaeria nubilosa]